MISMRDIRVRVGLYALASLCIHATATAQSTRPAAAAVPGSAGQDAQHAFDFEIGSWKVHVYRLQHPLTGSKSWVQYDGTNVVHEVWNGRSNLAELEADGPAGHIEFMSLRLYDPQGHQWSLNTTSSRQGALGVPTIGGFKGGRGEFFATEMIDGESILVRNAWADITADSWTFEQAFSSDGGQSWEVNWVEKATRIGDESGQADPVAPQTATTRDGQHDFDFEFGTWKTHVARLLHPLTGSKTWAQYDGITVVHKIWRGRANLVELDVAGPSGHLQLLSLRLYNPNARQWSLNSANSNVGTVNPPAIGEFANGRGEFFDQELLGDRAILVRFVISGITADSCHFEQAFSADGGKTWEVNWIATDTRVKEGSDAIPSDASQPGRTSNRW